MHIMHARRKLRNRDEGERVTWWWHCCRGGQRLCCCGRNCFQRRRERDQRDITVLFSSLSIFFSSLSRLPSVLLPPPFCSLFSPSLSRSLSCFLCMLSHSPFLSSLFSLSHAFYSSTLHAFFFFSVPVP